MFAQKPEQCSWRALLVIAKNWNPSRCPSTGEWLNKWWNTMEYYSVIKRNELTIQMNLRGTSLSEKKPIAKGYRLYDSIEHFQNDKVLEMGNRLVTANGAQVGRRWDDKGQCEGYL